MKAKAVGHDAKRLSKLQGGKAAEPARRPRAKKSAIMYSPITERR